MTPVALLVVVIVCIAACVVIGNKLNINIGLLAMAVTYILAVFVMKSSTKDVVSYWPTSTMFMVISLCLFFGYVNETGASNKIAAILLYKTRNVPALAPFSIMLIAIVLTATGANPFAVASICCPIIFNICSRTGKNPLLGFAMFTCGTNMMCYLPWSSAYAVQANVIKGGDLAEGSAKYMLGVCFGYMIFFFIMGLVLYFVLDGKNYITADGNQEKPEPFDAKQKQALILVVLFVAFVVLPTALATITKLPAIKNFSRQIDVGLIAVFFAAIAALMKLGDTKKVIQKQVPWTTVIMICGVAMLIAVASKGGAIDLVGEWIGTSIPKALVGPVLFICGGVLSMFVSTNNVAIPTLFALVPAIFASSGINPMVMYIAIAVGCSSTGCFPFSGSGSFALAVCQDEKQYKPLFDGQMKMAAFQFSIGIIISLIASIIL